MLVFRATFIPLECDSVHGRVNGTIAMSEVGFLMSRLVRVHVLCFRTLTFTTPTYSDLYHLVPASKSEPCSSDGGEVTEYPYHRPSQGETRRHQRSWRRVHGRFLVRPCPAERGVLLFSWRVCPRCHRPAVGVHLPDKTRLHMLRSRSVMGMPESCCLWQARIVQHFCSGCACLESDTESLIAASPCLESDSHLA